MTWTLTIDIPNSAWMTANRDYGRGGWKKRLVTDLQNLAVIVAGKNRMPSIPAPCDITWTIHYPKGVTWKADPENSAPTCKAILDGLVNAGYLEDDAPRFIRRRTWERGENLDVKGQYQIAMTATPVEGEGREKR